MRGTVPSVCARSVGTAEFGGGEEGGPFGVPGSGTACPGPGASPVGPTSGGDGPRLAGFGPCARGGPHERPRGSAGGRRATGPGAGPARAFGARWGPAGRTAPFTRVRRGRGRVGGNARRRCRPVCVRGPRGRRTPEAPRGGRFLRGAPWAGVPFAAPQGRWASRRRPGPCLRCGGACMLTRRSVEFRTSRGNRIDGHSIPTGREKWRSAAGGSPPADRAPLPVPDTEPQPPSPPPDAQAPHGPCCVTSVK